MKAHRVEGPSSLLHPCQRSIAEWPSRERCHAMLATSGNRYDSVLTANVRPPLSGDNPPSQIGFDVLEQGAYGTDRICDQFGSHTKLLRPFLKLGVVCNVDLWFRGLFVCHFLSLNELV